MGDFSELYFRLVYLLQTIPNKQFLLVLLVVDTPSKSIICFFLLKSYIGQYRCFVLPEKLDKKETLQYSELNQHLHTHEQTNDELQILFEIDTNIIISDYLTQFQKILLNYTFQSFSSHFPHANIYELITSNLLHQMIKGTFKNYLVM